MNSPTATVPLVTKIDRQPVSMDREHVIMEALMDAIEWQRVTTMALVALAAHMDETKSALQVSTLESPRTKDGQQQVSKQRKEEGVPALLSVLGMPIVTEARLLTRSRIDPHLEKEPTALLIAKAAHLTIVLLMALLQQDRQEIHHFPTRWEVQEVLL
jgi:hypothetical protein